MQNASSFEKGLPVSYPESFRDQRSAAIKTPVVTDTQSTVWCAGSVRVTASLSTQHLPLAQRSAIRNPHPTFLPFTFAFRLFLHHFDLPIDDLPREPVDCNMHPIALLAFDDEFR